MFDLPSALRPPIATTLALAGIAGMLLIACDAQQDPSAQVPASVASGAGTSAQAASGGASSTTPGEPASMQASAGTTGTNDPRMPQFVSSSAGIGGSNTPPMAGIDAGDAGHPTDDASTRIPTDPVAKDGWPMGSPEGHGLDGAQLDDLAEALQRASGNTRFGLVIVKEGALVYEKYWRATDADSAHPVFSCTKSWGSTLIGIAVHKGLLDVNDPVTKWVPEPAREVGTGALIKHLLTQTAQTTPPGTAFAYNSGSIVNTLPEILEAAAGMPSHAFYQAYLAESLKLGMTWPSCPAGGCPGTRYEVDYIQFGDRGPNGVLESTIRDQAKLGWLWLNDGVWNGERLLDTEYIEAATRPSFGFQSIYGYLWWLNREGPSSGPLGARLDYNPDVPNDMYHAVGGIGHCSVAVLPTQRLVIAHVGDTDLQGLDGHFGLFAPLFKP